MKAMAPITSLGGADLIPTFAWSSTAGSAMLEVNRYACEYLGISSPSVRGKSFFDFLDPCDRQALRDAMTEAVDSSATASVRAHLRDRAGNYRWHSINLKTRNAHAGKAPTVIGIALDTSEQDEVRTVVQPTRAKS